MSFITKKTLQKPHTLISIIKQTKYPIVFSKHNLQTLIYEQSEDLVITYSFLFVN
ncbi:hypothetical protein T190607A02C_170046 [Tenacibaculum sp. 190524A02b]